MTLEEKERLCRVAETAVAGEKARGDGGVVVLTAESATYKLVNEIESEELREQLEDLLSEHGRVNVVVVEEGVDTHTERRFCNVWMVPRQHVMDAIA